MKRQSFFRRSSMHGGDIVAASEHYGIDLDQWIDLSTGINPEPWPVEVDRSSFQQLPYLRPEFSAASSDYYGCSRFIAVAGTQTAIQRLPDLLEDLPILLPQTGYQQHAVHWRRKGATIQYYPALKKTAAIVAITQALADNARQHLVIINPNNPTGVLFDKQQLLFWAGQLATRACLIVDEAFIDTTPEHSVLDQELPDNIIVLRSFGKFFGLAGIRLGYCFASERVLTELQQRLGLWQVNGPAQAIASSALQDKAWQVRAIKQIQVNTQLTEEIFNPLLTRLPRGNHTCLRGPLFLCWQMPHEQALELADYFARAGILLRVIPLEEEIGKTRALLRIGLPGGGNALAIKRILKRRDSAMEIFTGRQ